MLVEFLHADVIRLDSREASIDLLARCGFIHRPATSQAFFVFDFTLAPATRKLLSEHPDVLGGAADEIQIEPYSRDGDTLRQLADRLSQRRRLR